MFLKFTFQNSLIFFHLILFNTNYCFAIWTNQKYPEPIMNHNSRLGKFYWFYNKSVNYYNAEKICIENKQKIVQLPTKQEHIWVNKHLVGGIACFWTDLKLYAFKIWQWKMIHGAIPNPASRWHNNIIPLLFKSDTAYAIGEHLYASNGSNSCGVVCQKEYSSRQTKFIRSTGQKFLGRQSKRFPGGVVHCASICMQTANCSVLVLHKEQEQMCTVFSGITGINSIDCNMEGTICLVQN